MSRFAPLAVFLLVFAGLGFGLTNNPQKMPSMLIDRALPTFSLQAVDGAAGGLSSVDVIGEVALVNVFASWCPVCREEHPMLEKLAAARDVKIYGVDWKDSRVGARRWLGYGNPYTRLGFDESGRVGVDLGVTGVPETFLVDRDGRVRYRHAGALTDGVWKDVFEPMIKALRSQK